MKGGAIMQFLTHIIFLLNLLKTLINTSAKDGDC